METNENEHKVLKQALQRRQAGQLPSNFSFRMMEQIRREAVKQQRRRERTLLYAIVAVSLSLFGWGVYLLAFRLDFRLGDYLPHLEWRSSFTPMLGFYLYIGVLVLFLLAFDYWMRRKKSAS